MDNTAPNAQAIVELTQQQRDALGPDWCWQLAGENLDGLPNSQLQRFGSAFLDVHHYRTLCDRGDVGLRQAIALYPAIGAAEVLNQDPEKTGPMKITVLGNLDPKLVCQKLGIEEAEFRAWEQTFFDVRDCGSATFWVEKYVVKPELAAGHADLAARLRMISAIGSAAAQAILVADTRVPLREAQRLFERQLNSA